VIRPGTPKLISCRLPVPVVSRRIPPRRASAPPVARFCRRRFVPEQASVAPRGHFSTKGFIPRPRTLTASRARGLPSHRAKAHTPTPWPRLKGRRRAGIPPPSYVAGPPFLKGKFPREFADLPFQFAHNSCTIHKRPSEGDSLLTHNILPQEVSFFLKKYPLHLPLSPSIPLPMTYGPTRLISGECHVSQMLEMSHEMWYKPFADMKGGVRQLIPPTRGRKT
jgi:hypothetical protein